MEPDSAELPQPETLYAAVLYLATNYAKSGCPMLCRLIMRQLACIANHPGDSVSQSLRETCGRLHAEWAHIAADRILALEGHADASEPRKIH